MVDVFANNDCSVLDMAGVSHPAPNYQGREIVHMRGKTMMPFISGSTESIHEKDFVEGWETCGRAAVRKGDWKMVFSEYTPTIESPPITLLRKRLLITIV